MSMNSLETFLVLSALLLALTAVKRSLYRRMMMHFVARRRKRRILLLHRFYVNRRLQRVPGIRRAWVWPRSQLFFDELLQGGILPEDMWRENFRVSRTTFRRICDIVRPELARRDTRLRRAIPLEKRVAVALYRLSTGDSYRSSGLNIGLPRSTANTIKNEFCEVLTRRAEEFIRLPRTEEETRRAILDFTDGDNARFPQVVGAVDGSHIRIRAPQVNAKDYFCRKKFHSVLLQGVADRNGRFLHVSTGYPGSIHDSRMLRMSSLFDDIANGRVLSAPTKIISGRSVKPLLLGDPAYSLKSCLMKPYPETARMSPSQRNFNTKLSSSRVAVEQAFGLLKGRWRCLLDTLTDGLNRVPTTIIACCVLHNICIDARDDTVIEIPRRDDGNNHHPGHLINAGGENIRECIRRHLDTV